MKVSIFDGEQGEKEQEIILRLVSRGSTKRLIMVDEKGTEIPSGNLLSIHSDMTIQRCHHISTTMGLPLDNEGRIKLIGEGD